MDLAYRSELKEVNAHNFALFDAKLEQRFAEQDAKFEKRFADLDLALATTESRLVRWMFVFWSTNFIALAGLALAVMRTR